jgi:ribosome-associated toxin RatA of RatAB toxin-antitoxin module
MFVRRLVARRYRPALAAGLLVAASLVLGAEAEAARRVPVSETKVPGRDMPRLEATWTIPAPVERVWALISDCNRFAEFMKDVERSRVLSRNGKTTRCELVVDVPFPFGSLHSVSDAHDERQPGIWRQSWQLVSGDFHYDEGYWELRPVASGQTMVHYVSLTEPKLPVPRGRLLEGQKDFIADMLLRLDKRLRSPS